VGWLSVTPCRAAGGLSYPEERASMQARSHAGASGR
jgi:hypothetical protein